MIKFYGVSEKTGSPYEIDVTHLKISFIEESSLFYDYFLKGYSLPFSFKIDSPFASKFDFISDFNSINYSIEISGTLQIDGKFDVAVLKLKRQRGNKIEGTFYYGRQSIPLMNMKLLEFGWPIIDAGSSLTTFAASQLEKSYPETDFNFPMVYHPEFSADNYDEYYLGFLNNYDGVFKTNLNLITTDGPVARNFNAMVPMPYILAILRQGFEFAQYALLGEFITHPVANKLILFTEKHLLKYESDLPDSFVFDGGTQVWQGGFTTATFRESYRMSIVGSYTISSWLNIAKAYDHFEFTITYANEVIFSSNANFSDTLALNITEENKNFFLNFKLVLKERGPNTHLIDSVDGQNLFKAEFLGGTLNVYPKTFSLAEVLPDMTFGTFLNKLKNWLNLEVRLEANKVIIDFVENNFSNKPVHDESAFEIPIPERLFKKKQLYKLIHGQHQILIGPDGQVYSQEGFSDNEIVTINAGVEMMPVESTEQGFTAVKKDGTLDFQVLFYNGLQNSKPMAVAQVNDYTFTLQQIYQLFWKKWLHFRLNAETFKDKFRANTFAEFNMEKLRYKYTCKHVYKKIKRTREDADNWTIEIESETL